MAAKRPALWLRWPPFSEGTVFRLGRAGASPAAGRFSIQDVRNTAALVELVAAEGLFLDGFRGHLEERAVDVAGTADLLHFLGREAPLRGKEVEHLVLPLFDLAGALGIVKDGKLLVDVENRMVFKIHLGHLHSVQKR